MKKNTINKKTMTTVIASAVAAVAANPAVAGNNDREGLDNPLQIDACTFDEAGFDAHWTDPNESPAEDTKYGGDLEVDAWLFYFCDAQEESFDGSTQTTLEFDLSKDAEDAFSYECVDEDGATLCWASLSWEDANAAAEAAVQDFVEETDAAELCEAVDGNFFAGAEFAPFDGGSVFSVKEMKPGNGGGRQNWVKSFEICSEDFEV